MLAGTGDQDAEDEEELVKLMEEKFEEAGLEKRDDYVEGEEEEKEVKESPAPVVETAVDAAVEAEAEIVEVTPTTESVEEESVA